MESARRAYAGLRVIVGEKRTAASVATEASQLGFLVLRLSSRSSPSILLFFSLLFLLATLISSVPLVSLGAAL